MPPSNNKIIIWAIVIAIFLVYVFVCLKGKKEQCLSQDAFYFRGVCIKDGRILDL